MDGIFWIKKEKDFVKMLLAVFLCCNVKQVTFGGGGSDRGRWLGGSRVPQLTCI